MPTVTIVVFRSKQTACALNVTRGDMTDQLYPFQVRGVEWLTDSSARGRILADDMGLGKTVQVLSAIEQKQYKRNLIVTLNSARRVWRKEIPRWAPRCKFVVIDAWEQSVAQRIEAILDKSNQIVVINYQLMLRLIDTLTKVYWNTVVFDEAQTLRNRYSETHKKHRLLVRKSNCERVWHLTGTPVNNHQEDYWPMLRDFVPGFGSYWDFANKYCQVDTIYPPKYVGIVAKLQAEGQPIPPAIQRAAYGQQVSSVTDPDDPRTLKLVEAIRPHVLRRTKEQVYPDMPPKTVQIVSTILDSESRKIYKSLDEKMCARLPTGDEILIDTELAQTTRLLQVATDWQLLLGEKCRDLILEGEKARALLESIDEIDDQPFVVFSKWSRVIDMCSNLLDDKGITNSKYTGENAEHRDEKLDAWNVGQTQGLLVTLAAGGVGLDFTHASYGFFLDRSWNPKVNEQAEDRLYRHGQTRPVLIRVFQTEGTIESDDQALSILSKEQISENLVESLVE